MTRGRVCHLYNPESLGIGRYAKGLEGAMQQLGWEPAGAADADLWHVHYGNSSRLFPMLLRPTRKPVVLTVHDVLPRSPRLRRLVGAGIARAWQRKASVTVVHNSYARQLLGGKAEVVPMYAFSSLQSPRQHAGLRVGVFGRFAAHKGLSWVQEAFRSIPPTAPIHLTLCGQGAAQQGAEWGNVTVIDRPTNEQFDRELATMDLIVAARLDSVGESSALIPQALASGVAVLYNPESARQNDIGGAGIEVRSSAELRDALLQLAADPQRLRRLQARALETGAALALSQIAKRYDALYAAALGGGRA
jgi:glycosyltransferase involved in cell wall biosynthesis